MKNEVIRQCRACRTLKNRNDLIKITLKDNELYINPPSDTVGRSVYVCKNKDCINSFIKSKGIKKGLKFNDEAKIEKISRQLQEALHGIQ